MNWITEITSAQRTQRSLDFGASQGKLEYVLSQLRSQLIAEDDIYLKVSLEIMIESVVESIALQEKLFQQEIDNLKIA